MTQRQHEELEELKHEAWPGYLTAFLVVFGAAAVYLIIIFASTMGHH